MRSSSQALGLLLTLALGTAWACKRNDGAVVKDDPPAAAAPRGILVINHGGHWSCGSQSVTDATENLYETLGGAPVSAATADSDNQALCSLSAADRSKLESFVQADSGTTAALPNVCAGLALTEPTDPPRPRSRSTPLTMDFHPKLTNLVQQITQNGREVKWISTCYPMGDATNDDPPETGRFTHVYLSQSDEPTKTYKTTRTAMWRLITERARDVDVYIIGHSHGGWTAMQDILRNNLTVRGLVTFDPISLPECNYNTYVIGANPFNTTQIPACLRFPNDISAAQRRTLATSAGWWLNFHVAGNRLHSGPATDAANTVAEQDKSTTDHSGIKLMDDLWQQAIDRINGRAAEPSGGGSGPGSASGGAPRAPSPPPASSPPASSPPASPPPPTDVQPTTDGE